MNQDFYDAWEQVTLSPEADERIRRTLERPGPAGKRAETMKGAGRRLSKTAVAVLLAAVLLTVTALAAPCLDFSEVSETLRRLLNIKSGDVPGYVTYETVTEAAGARYADPAHSGRGEVYVTPSGYSVRTENFLTVTLNLWRVTPEQYGDESFVWRVQLPGREEYIAAQPESYSETRGDLLVRVTVFADDLPDDSFPLTVYGGYERDGGFEIARVGTVSVDVPAQDESVTLSLGNGLAFYNEATGQEGRITSMEIHPDMVIVIVHIDGMYGLQSGPDTMAEQMDWANSLLHFIAGTELIMEDGTRCLWRSGWMNCLPDDTYMEVMDLPDTIDPDDVESILIGGQTYALP